AGPRVSRPPGVSPASGGRLPAVSLSPSPVHSQLQQLYAMPRQQLASLSLLQLSALVQQLTLLQQQQQLTALQQYQLNVLLQQLNGLQQQQFLQAQQRQFQQLNALR